jgi:hypothetical protein
MGLSVGPRAGGNVLLAGDAAGTINPFNGEGIAYGYETGRLAAAALGHALSGEGPRALADYDLQLEAAYGPYYKVARAFVRMISNPQAMKLCVGVGMRSEFLMSQLLRIMANLMRPDAAGPAGDRLPGHGAGLAPPARARGNRIGALGSGCRLLSLEALLLSRQRRKGSIFAVMLAALVLAPLASVLPFSTSFAGPALAVHAAAADLAQPHASTPGQGAAAVAEASTPGRPWLLDRRVRRWRLHLRRRSFYGSLGGQALNAPIVAMASTPDGRGYWLVASDGGVFSFGDATFYGSTGGMHLNAPIVGMAATPDGGGYWLVASDGGVFSFGDATFYGSTGGMHLNAPIVGMAATPDGGGYWLVASDGGVFSFGDATFYGSTGAHASQRADRRHGGHARRGRLLARRFRRRGLQLRRRHVLRVDRGHASQRADRRRRPPDGGGYWLVASDGGVFSFGDATFYGSATADINPLLVDELANTDGAQQVIVVDAPNAASTTATLYTFENDGRVVPGVRTHAGPRR